MAKKSKITVIGSSNTDMVVMTSHFPAPGETILGGEFLMNPGGKGANQAVAAARLGGSVTFIGKVGSDIFGDEAVENIKKEGIDVSAVTRDEKAPSGVAQILVDSKGENCIVVAPGANLNLNRTDIDNAMEKILNADILLMQLEVPIDTVVYAAKKAHRAGVKVILNPAPAAQLPDELYECLYMITPNESETELLTGVKVTDETSALEAADVFKAKGVESTIITMGSKGAYIFSDEWKGTVPAFEVNPVDTTAAGDCFNGALAVALAQSDGLSDAVVFANRAASIAVTRAGAQASLPFRAEVEEA
ncbi:MAG: ribokinase [Balneolaceae bacterium]|nr:MAG: ribokinase [Balneolaceae bacterium]